MLNAGIGLLDLGLQTSDLVFRGFVRIVLRCTTLSAVVHLLTLLEADLLCVMQLLLREL